MMHGRDTQRGAALVLFLGIAAALAILSVALIMTVANASHNTSRAQRSVKSFDIAEAALDVTMQQLARAWPRTQSRAFSPWTEVENPTFAEDFYGTASPSPLPDGGHYVSVRVFDDVEATTTLPAGWETSAATYDSNRNGVLLVDAQARVGERSSRIRGAVKAQYYRLGVARGVAVWADGTLAGTGSGNDPNITAEVLAYNSYQAMVHAGEYDPSTTGLWDNGLITQDPPDSGTKPPISQDTIEGLVQIAQNSGRYFAGPTAESDMKTALADADPGPFEGLCVLDFRDLGGTYTVTMDQGDYNCDLVNNGQQTLVEYGDPGALLILGGNLVLKGGLHYYGLIYVEGGNIGVDDDGGSSIAGKPVIHGMLFCMKPPDDPDGPGGNVDLRGRAQVRYNANAARDLDSQFLTGAQLVENGWRELQPTPAP
jgi:hypothetical protein